MKLLFLPLLLASCYFNVAGPQRPADAIPHHYGDSVMCRYQNQDVAYCYLDSGPTYSCVYAEMEWKCVQL